MRKTTGVLTTLGLLCAPIGASAQRGAPETAPSLLLAHGAATRQALTTAVSGAAAMLGQPDGFKSSDVRIMLPPPVAAQENKLRSLGFGNLIDQVIDSQNRAAEQAASFAPTAFAPAITSLVLPPRIRHGGSAATGLLASQSRAVLLSALRPHVDQALESTGASAKYAQLAGLYNKIAIVPSVIDLPDYVTARTLDALLVRMASHQP